MHSGPCVVAAALLVALAAPLTASELIFLPGGKEYPTPQELHGMRIPMRDGVTLAGDVFLPKASGGHPVIIELTPYGRGDGRENFRAEAPLWTARGYVLVIADTRGQGESGGRFGFFQADVNDGYDLVEWAAAQPWSNGRIGMRGSSYSGSNQWYAAKNRPPHLRCLNPNAAVVRPFVHVPYAGGAFMLGWGLNWISGQGSDIADSGLPKGIAIDWTKLLDHRPLATADTAAFGRPLALYQQFLAHPTLDAFWKPIDLSPSDFDGLDVATLAFSGWFDGTLPGTVYAYQQMRNRSRARTRQFLVVGPWEHLSSPDGGYDYKTGSRIAQVGDLHLPDDAFVFGQDLTRRFFDWCLRDGPKFAQASARFFVTGSNRWVDLPSFPAPDTRTVALYLHSGGNANALHGDGRLDSSKPGSEAVDRYAYDPLHPLWSQRAGAAEPPAALEGHANDLASTIDRPDVLVYVSPVLEAPLTILGNLRLRLDAASDARDTDFVSFIEDVGPDGKAIRLGSGVGAVQRARFRHGLEREELLTPNRPETFQLDFHPIGHTFRPGHRIRLSVTSSAYPAISANPNTGNPIASDTESPRVAHQTVLHDAVHPSQLILPVIPTP